MTFKKCLTSKHQQKVLLKMLRARVVVTLDIDKEEFPMPVDGNPSEELEEAIQDVLDEVYGTHVVGIKVSIKGEDNGRY